MCKYASSFACTLKWVLRQSFEGFVRPWLTDAKSMLFSSCRNRCSKDNSSTASFQLHLSCWKACLSESLAIFQGILVSPRKQTNYPYSPFFLKCFDLYGHNITTAATDVATWEAVPSQGKVVCVLQLLSPWSLQEHGSCESGRWQGTCLQFPHLLQNGALLDHCLFNEQWIIPSRSEDACMQQDSQDFCSLFSHFQNQIPPCSHAFCMGFQFLGQGCLHLMTVKRKTG